MEQSQQGSDLDEAATYWLAIYIFLDFFQARGNIAGNIGDITPSSWDDIIMV